MYNFILIVRLYLNSTVAHVIVGVQQALPVDVEDDLHTDSFAAAEKKEHSKGTSLTVFWRKAERIALACAFPSSVAQAGDMMAVHSVQVVFQFGAPGQVAQFQQRSSFDLAHALAGNVECLAHFEQGTRTPVFQSIAQLQHLAFTLGQAVEQVLHLVFEELSRGQVSGVLLRVVFHNIGLVAVLVFRVGEELQTLSVLTEFDDLAHALRRDPHLLANFL